MPESEPWISGLLSLLIVHDLYLKQLYQLREFSIMFYQAHLKIYSKQLNMKCKNKKKPSWECIDEIFKYSYTIQQTASSTWAPQISVGCYEGGIQKRAFKGAAPWPNLQRVNYTAECLLHLLISSKCCNFLDLWIAGVSLYHAHNSVCLALSPPCWAETIPLSPGTPEPSKPLAL